MALQPVIEAALIVFLSELGDRTFFINLILAMNNNRLQVFLGAFSAACIMVLLTSVCGLGISYAFENATILLVVRGLYFVFAVLSFWTYWKSQSDSGSDVNKKLEKIENKYI
jgi:putative Ca2+/H+ antiporter (TMEM165/GDT1 family)